MITLWSHPIWSVNSVVSPLIRVTVSLFFDTHYASFLWVKQNNESEQVKLSSFVCTSKFMTECDSLM